MKNMFPFLSVIARFPWLSSRAGRIKEVISVAFEDGLLVKDGSSRGGVHVCKLAFSGSCLFWDNWKQTPLN